MCLYVLMYMCMLCVYVYVRYMLMYVDTFGNSAYMSVHECMCFWDKVSM